jgi:NAD(P)-dependent dehydrogenase (short-subunit alcohol dehydrogenase family)
VILACRDPQRGEAARKAIVEATGNPAVELGIVDLGRQDSIREFAGGFLESHRELHVLVNNAGTWANRRRETPERIEETWAVNVLGYFLLTELLLGRLRASAPGMASSVYAKVSGKTPEQGADTVVWLASDPEVEGKSGEFWIDRRKVRCRFRDPAAEERLWALCASMTRAAR